MSWTRRFLVLTAFALMLAGVALMVIQKDELFLGLSVAGFALVLAAVPSLPKERAGEDLVGEPSAPAGSTAEASGEQPPRETPTALTAEKPTLEHGAVTVPAPQPEAAEWAGRGEPAGPGLESAAGTAIEEPREPAGAGGEPVPATVPEPPSRPAEAEQLAPAPAAGPGGGGRPGSARKLAIGGTAAGAVVLLWRWLRR